MHSQSIRLKVKQTSCNFIIILVQEECKHQQVVETFDVIHYTFSSVDIHWFANDIVKLL